jgi:hypothetical protein
MKHKRPGQIPERGGGCHRLADIPADPLCFVEPLAHGSEIQYAVGVSGALMSSFRGTLTRMVMTNTTR